MDALTNILKTEIEAEYSVFIDKAAFKITSDIPNCVVRFTSDGSIPTSESPIATGLNSVIALNSIVVKALCFKDGQAVSALSEKCLSREEPVPAVLVQNVKPGLEYRYFEGVWGELPDFSALIPFDKGIVQTIDLSIKKGIATIVWFIQVIFRFPKRVYISFFSLPMMAPK
jgi:hypothetical protein